VELATAARGIIDIANANIDRALRRVSVARGYDPRRFTLVAFGGAGALHACEVADGLQMHRVLVPRFPGVLCAFGLLVADVVIDYSQSVLQMVDENTLDTLAGLLETMITQARDDLTAEGIERPQRDYLASLDVRYAGQAHELNIPASDITDIAATFHAAHRRAYGHALEDRPVEVVNLRLQAVGQVTPPDLVSETEIVPAAAPLLDERLVPSGDLMRLYNRGTLEPGMQFSGSALVFQLDGTVYVPPGWQAYVDGYHNLILERYSQ